MDKKGFLYVIGSASIFGAMPLFTRLLYASGFDTVSCGFYRTALMLIFILIYNFFVTKCDMRLTKNDVFVHFILGICFAGTSIFLFGSYNCIKSGVATSIHFIFPAVTFVISSFLNKKIPNVVDIVCIFITMFAIFIMMDFSNMDNVTGVVMAALSAFTFSGYGVVLERIKIDDKAPIKMLFYVNFFCAIILYVYAVLFGDGIYYQGIDTRLMIFLLTYSFFLTIGGALLFQQAVLCIGATYTSMISTAEIVISTVLGFIFLHEALSVRQIVAIVLIIISALLLISSKIKK